ncbi:MAG: hypothetical protein NVSMB13_04580 [Mycobacteriales bacterium]
MVTSNSRRARALPGLSRFAQRHARWVVLAWVLLAGALLVVAPSLTKVGVQDQSKFLPQGAQSQQALELLTRLFPQDPSSNAGVIVFERPTGLTPVDRQYAADVAHRLTVANRSGAGGVAQVLAVGEDPRLASLLRSKDGRAELVVVGYRTAAFADVTIASVRQLRTELRAAPPGLTHKITGLAGLGADQDSALKSTFTRVGLISVLLVVGILLAVYRSAAAAAIPLVTIAVAFAVAQSLVALLAQAGVQVASLAATFMVVLVFGAGTDYCLFLVSRYRAELSPGEAPADTLGRTTDVMTGVIVASGAAVTIGFLAQFTAKFGFYRTMGPAIGLAVLVTVLAALTLTPAILTLAGKHAFWPVRLDALQARPPQTHPRWARLGELVGRWPAETALAAVTPMVLLSAGLAAIHTSTDLLGELPPSSEARVGAAVIGRHFPVGASAPISVILAGTEPIRSGDRLSAVDKLTDALRATPGIAEVRSATQPAGAPLTGRATPGSKGADLRTLGLDPNKVDVTPLYNALASPRGLRLTQDVLRRYPQLTKTTSLFQGTDANSTRLIVLLDTAPFGKSAQQTARRISALAQRSLAGSSLAGAHVAVAGPAAAFGDIETTASHDFLGIAVVLTIAILLVLAALLRSLLLPVLLVGTALLSYTAALGFTALVGRFVLGQEGVAFYLPAFLMVILVALGSDYNIFITSRIREERDAGHSISTAAVRGLVATGPVISNAGLILAGTFAALAFAPIPTLQQVGIAVAFGVLLDTFVVRPLLVPALVILLGQHAFWPEGLTTRPGRRWTAARIQTSGVATAAVALIASFGLVLASGTAASGLPTISQTAAQQATSASSAKPSSSAESHVARRSPTPTAKPTGNVRSVPSTAPRRGATGSAQAPAKPAAAPRRSDSAQGRTTRVAPPAVGAWTYHLHGTRKVGAAGSEQSFDEDATTQVSPLGGTADSPELRLRTDTNAGSQQYDRRYAPARVQLLATQQSSAALSYGGQFDPPQDLIRWPVQPGATWSSDWTLGTVQGHTDNTVQSNRTVTISRTTYTCYVIDSRTTFRGDAQGNQHTTSCWVAELGMVASEHQTFQGSYKGVPFDSDVTSNLLKGP